MAPRNQVSSVMFNIILKGSMHRKACGVWSLIALVEGVQEALDSVIRIWCYHVYIVAVAKFGRRSF